MLRAIKFRRLHPLTIVVSICFAALILCTKKADHHLLTYPSASSFARRPWTNSLSSQLGPHAKSPCNAGGGVFYAEHDESKLKRYGLSSQVILHKGCIAALRDELTDRDTVQEVNESFLSPEKGAMISLDNNNTYGWDSMPSFQRISLNVPPPFPKGQYSHLLFGVATSYDRLNSSMEHIAHWLADSDARLLAVMVDAEDYTDEHFDELVAQFKHHGIKLILQEPWNESVGTNEQHFTVIRNLLHEVDSETEWIAVIDDDTFFPSLYALSQFLDAYDSSMPVYVGALSESFDAVASYGFMAFGGAGVFLSVPLVRELNPWIEYCLDEYQVPQGDWVLNACIREKTDARMTPLSGLHQLDIMGDPGGFYESGRFPLSLHHWKSWHHVPVAEMAKITDYCGKCFLQRWRFGHDTILNNGFSIAVYGQDTRSLDLQKTEASWDNVDDFEWSLGPLREAVDARSKKVYYLVETQEIGANTRQIYIHRAAEDDNPRVDEVAEVWWEWH